MTGTARTNSFSHALFNARYLGRILTRKPHFALRLGWNYARLPLRYRRPPLRFVDVALTYDCTMNCTHCSALCLKRPGVPLLTPVQYGTVAAKLRAAGALVVNFTGGEPLLRKDFFEILEAFRPERMLVAVQTNASLLTREVLARLRSSGVDSIGISLDGAASDLHDSFRNRPGAFDQALCALRAGQSMGFNMGISYCLTHQNLHSSDRERMVSLSRELGAILNYNLAVPIGKWAGETEPLLTPQDRRDLDRMLRETPHTKTDHETNYFRRGCGAIKEKLYVTAYGDVMPCPFIHVEFGNLLADSVEAVRKRAFAYGCFRRYEPLCLAAEDASFIANTRCYHPDAENLPRPIPHGQAFLDPEAAKSGHGSRGEGREP